MQNDKLLNYLHLHFIVFIWGFTAVLGALISIEAIPLVWYRMLLASGFMFLFIVYKKENLRFPKKVLGGFFFAGLVIALHWLAFFGAIKVSNVSVTLAIMSTGALFASLLEPILYKRKVIWYEVFFGLIVVAGLYVIFNVESEHVWGIVLALCSSFLGALFSVINGKFALSYKASVISFYEIFFGMVCISIYLAFSGSFDSSFFQLTTNDWLFLVLLASVCTAYAFIASVHVMKWISPYTVMLTTNMEPVYGILLALLILGDSENMSPQFYFGAAIILVTVIANGIIKTSIERKKRRLPNT
ncbi:DMT family transporter [Ulvibacter litoralis]|uniref:EamA domain-containing membrane protein RarD n=1 Tax=Ulvibacter litoralis TaxID=227084 RepID=A0A1G7JD94_9FLAO|nr:DMT family transporter [Ulvibacter litoralis]GHC64784.1 permease [Ulvibacter litoralis]SDF22853.1 EamA domain-containing membrane protein RarD [Ulvibacter litoralis]